MISDTRFSLELETLNRLLKIGLVRKPEYNFARTVLERQIGEV